MQMVSVLKCFLVYYFIRNKFGNLIPGHTQELAEHVTVMLSEQGGAAIDANWRCR